MRWVSILETTLYQAGEFRKRCT